jgi:hypothetical protein
LFDFPEMTRVLHAGEDLMDAVRQGRVPYSKELADRLLDAMDFVGMLCDEVDADGGIGATHAADSARLAESLRLLISDIAALEVDRAAPARATPSAAADDEGFLPALADIPEATRMAAYRRAAAGECLCWLDYVPAEECFFQGDDPFFQARGTPGLLWGDIRARQPWPKLAELDAYRCLLDFHLLSAAPSEELDEYFRYMPEEVSRVPVPPLFLALPQGEPNGGPVYEDFGVDALALLNRGDLDGLRRAARTLLELSGPELWLSSALRWLLLVIEVEPQNREALAVLLESLTSLAPPRWGDCRRNLDKRKLDRVDSAALRKHADGRRHRDAHHPGRCATGNSHATGQGRLAAGAPQGGGRRAGRVFEGDGRARQARPGGRDGGSTGSGQRNAAADLARRHSSRTCRNWALPRVGLAKAGFAVQTAGALVQPEAQKAPPSAAEGEVKFGPCRRRDGRPRRVSRSTRPRSIA